MDGFVLLNRKILDWEWYKDTYTKVVFIHCLINANWKDGRFQGKEVKRGSFISSYRQIANECNLSVQSVRTAINHLKSTHEITSEGTTKYTVFTVVRYDYYQSINTLINNRATNNQQTTNNNRIKKEGNNKKNNNVHSISEGRRYDVEQLEKMFVNQ